MRKSSLGRRSSTHIPVRVPSLGASGLGTCSGSKKSMLKQPGYSQQNRRSQSEDRDSYGGRATIGGLVRSCTDLSRAPSTSRNLGAMTPRTPYQNIHSNLPTGSVQAPRTSTLGTTDSNRMSSFGGTKNARKDSRPIGEKAFQQQEQAKVQNYFNMYGTEIIGCSGNSIRPMNAKLFVDMMDFLMKKIDSHIVITKSNYIEELPGLLKKLGYRSKVDRSWLMTVNTPHSWQHVIAVLSWLVDLMVCYDVLDPFDLLSSNSLDESKEEENDDEEEDLKIDKDLILFLKKTYKYKDDPMSEEILNKMDSEYINKMITEHKCTDEDFEILEREIDIKRKEMEGETQKRDALIEIMEKLKKKHIALQNDCKHDAEFIEESKTFTSSIEAKLEGLDQEIALKRTVLSKKQEELVKIQEKVHNQQLSVNDKDQIAKEKRDLQRMILFFEKGIREYESSVFEVDLKSAEEQRKLEKSIVDYNKIVAENVFVEPRLKDVEVKFTLLSERVGQIANIVDENLKTLKEEYKNSILNLKSKKEELENNLWQVKQNQKETEENIAKEVVYTEGIECDIEKQEELTNRESQKLKEELGRYQKMTKETLEEISQFDPAKLEAKKEELKKIEHDWVLLQKRTKEVTEKQLERTKEAFNKIQEAAIPFAKVAAEFARENLD